MAISVHYHRFPSCGTKHNTACSGYPNGDVCDGPLGERSPHAGEYICVHVGRVSISREALFSFIQDNAREWFADPTGREGEFVLAGTRSKRRTKPRTKPVARKK